MSSSILSTLGILAMAAPAATLDGDAGKHRAWLPEPCVQVLEIERAKQAGDEEPETGEARWNRFYRLGIDAIAQLDLEQASADFCRALDAAASFGPRDIRFAETLDELGLVAFMGEDYATAEAMQGAATAEMLLALGPPPGDLEEAAKQDCKSSVATYMARLGWIFERQGRHEDIDLLMREPHRILEWGYIPLESVLARLDWLISRYLLAEDFAAADRLTSLRVEASAE